MSMLCVFHPWTIEYYRDTDWPYTIVHHKAGVLLWTESVVWAVPAAGYRIIERKQHMAHWSDPWGWNSRVTHTTPPDCNENMGGKNNSNCFQFCFLVFLVFLLNSYLRPLQRRCTAPLLWPLQLCETDISPLLLSRRDKHGCPDPEVSRSGRVVPPALKTWTNLFWTCLLIYTHTTRKHLIYLKKKNIKCHARSLA